MDDSNSSNCSLSGEVILMTVTQGVMGSMGTVVCIVALVIIIISRFFKNIVQRLIVYKLIAMMVFSLSESLLLVFFGYNGSEHYKILARIMPGLIPASYFTNLLLTFWLSFILFSCIIFLKDMKIFRRLDALVIISSLLGTSIYIYYFIFAKFDDCTFSWNTNSSHEESVAEHIFIGFGIFFGLAHVANIVMAVVIFVRACLHAKHNDENEEENPLLISDKWRTLLKELLPLMVYPIITILFSFMYLTVYIAPFSIKRFSAQFALTLLLSAPGPVTGLVIVVHLCILKHRKKQRTKIKEKVPKKVFSKDVFTEETLCSTNSRTKYEYERTSSVDTN